MKQILIIGLLMCTLVVSGQRTKYNNMTEKDGKIGIGTKTPDELLTVKGKIHTQEVSLADDVDLASLAEKTVGLSGADLRNLVNEAALLAARKEKDL